ncbi:hypothetical protein H3H37_11605 [Duganella sp. LX20W]|uniref:Lipoprotein n=1 Tax=Rugamonas brunnea TaxID=2758569 RepID=A0A7W2ESC3_9BURK|nr:hypothetical protein [Rugamonas brunnea]MBA5637701.1 hypothetical protein [Rugamonas brunnea]
MNTTPFTLLALAAALACAACAPLPAAHDVDWKNGARHGWVSGFYDASTPRSELPRCLASVTAEELANHRFVRIDYRHSRRMMVEVGELPGDMPVKLGDRVELWPQDCDQGKLSRISRVMPPPAA